MVLRCLDLERVGRQFDLHGVGAELGNGTGVALFAGHGEFEVVHAGQALAAVGVAHETDALERDIAIEQFQVKLGAVLLDPLQGLFTQAVVMPQPGACRGQQHQHEEISQGQHLHMLQRGMPSLTASPVCRTGGI
ncbi:hypothetical protein D3C79_606990 [compost metagenome]